MAKSYYADNNDDRADWWANILSNGSSVFASIALPGALVGSIANDAAWGHYLYGTLRETYDEMTKRIIGWADAITAGTDGTALPDAPSLPTFPTPPVTAVLCGIEARRGQWVKTVKSMPLYDPGTHGATLRIEAPSSSFDPVTYKAVLYGLGSPAARQLRFKFRKANGEIDGINLKGRKRGTGGWTDMGRFTATPGNVLVPLAGAAPEEWEFCAMAVKRDVEIGVASDILPQLIGS